MCPTHPDFVNHVAETVANTVEQYKSKIPLIKMEWSKHLDSWADK
jgi:hypothetical protein